MALKPQLRAHCKARCPVQVQAGVTLETVHLHGHLVRQGLMVKRSPPCWHCDDSPRESHKLWSHRQWADSIAVCSRLGFGECLAPVQQQEEIPQADQAHAVPSGRDLAESPSDAMHSAHAAYAVYCKRADGLTYICDVAALACSQRSGGKVEPAPFSYALAQSPEAALMCNCHG